MLVSDFFEALKKEKINFFCGVPDSLLKEFCAFLTDNISKTNHIITANEGNALALAAGHYLATREPALVYMQNSGLGNIINPMMSLLDEEIYRIPAMLLIGWRGEPSTKDEPQHLKQGKTTLPLLKTLGIKYEILSKLNQIHKAKNYIKRTKKPFAFVVRRGIFEPYSQRSSNQNSFSLMREDAIKKILSLLNKNDIIVSSTGMISREVYENEIIHERDFLTVGSMGHTSSIALGIALEKKDRKIICLDGDGAFIMHMGAVPVIGACQPNNFKHIVFNNEAHDSVGGQPTCVKNCNISDISKSCGYTYNYTVKSLKELEKVWREFYNHAGTGLLEIKVRCGARKDLGRPKEKPSENKEKFMNFIE